MRRAMLSAAAICTMAAMCEQLMDNSRFFRCVRMVLGLEIVAAFEKASGRPVPYKICPRRPGDIATCYADTARAANLLGWKATRDIDDMCRDGWNFAKNRY